MQEEGPDKRNEARFIRELTGLLGHAPDEWSAEP